MKQSGGAYISAELSMEKSFITSGPYCFVSLCTLECTYFPGQTS